MIYFYYLIINIIFSNLYIEEEIKEFILIKKYKNTFLLIMY